MRWREYIIPILIGLAFMLPFYTFFSLSYSTPTFADNRVADKLMESILCAEGESFYRQRGLPDDVAYDGRLNECRNGDTRRHVNWDGMVILGSLLLSGGCILLAGRLRKTVKDDKKFRPVKLPENLAPPIIQRYVSQEELPRVDNDSQPLAKDVFYRLGEVERRYKAGLISEDTYLEQRQVIFDEIDEE